MLILSNIILYLEINRAQIGFLSGPGQKPDFLKDRVKPGLLLGRGRVLPKNIRTIVGPKSGPGPDRVLTRF